MGLQIWAAVEPNAVSSRVAVGCHVKCDGLGQNKIVRVGKNSGPVLSRLWAKLMKFCDNVGDSSYFPAPLPDCLFHVSFSRYSPLSLEVVEKPNKYKSFLVPKFFGRDDPNFSTADCCVTYRPPFGKVWLSSVCWSSLAKPGNEGEWNAVFTELV